MASPGAPKLAAPVPCMPQLGLMIPRQQLPPLDVQRALDFRIRYSLALQQHQQQQQLQQQQQQQQQQHHHHPAFPGHFPHLGMPSHPHDPMMAYLYAKDPRARFFHEEPKPSYSYIGLISMALLSSKDKKLILGDIYQWILDNYPYFRARGPGWRNSIRHNLSLNDCFIKSGRAANGKGHYWAIHPANLEDFKRGDFRRRRAQRKVRKAMGLDVPDEEDSPSPPPGTAGPLDWRARMIQDPAHRPRYPSLPPAAVEVKEEPAGVVVVPSPSKPPGKRGFDVASLLAPDMNDSGVHTDNHEEDEEVKEVEEEEEEEWIDVDSTGEELPSELPTQLKTAKRKLELDNIENSDNLEVQGRQSISPPPFKIPRTESDVIPNETPSERSDDNDITTSMTPGGWNIRPPPSMWLPNSKPGSFFPSPFLPWPTIPSSFPSSFTAAALYANALSRPLTQTPASLLQNGGHQNHQQSPEEEQHSPNTTTSDTEESNVRTEGDLKQTPQY